MCWSVFDRFIALLVFGFRIMFLVGFRFVRWFLVLCLCMFFVGYWLVFGLCVLLFLFSGWLLVGVWLVLGWFMVGFRFLLVGFWLVLGWFSECVWLISSCVVVF